MEKPNLSKISLQKIQLIECIVGDIALNAELKYSLGITDLRKSEFPDTRQLVVVVGFDLMMDVAKPACKFTCKFMVTYSKEAEDALSWNDLPEHIIIAHVVPFFREFVTNMTMRMPIKVLVMVPPVNTIALLANYHQKVKPAVPAS